MSTQRKCHQRAFWTLDHVRALPWSLEGKQAAAFGIWNCGLLKQKLHAWIPACCLCWAEPLRSPCPQTRCRAWCWSRKGQRIWPLKAHPSVRPGLSVSVPQEQTCALGLATLSISCLPAWCHSITSTLAAGWYGLSLTRKERKRRREQDPAEELQWGCRAGWDERSLPHGPGTFPADMGTVPRGLL